MIVIVRLVVPTRPPRRMVRWPVPVRVPVLFRPAPWCGYGG